jgi:hypothetical protein
MLKVLVKITNEMGLQIIFLVLYCFLFPLVTVSCLTSFCILPILPVWALPLFLDHLPSLRLPCLICAPRRATVSFGIRCYNTCRSLDAVQ